MIDVSSSPRVLLVHRGELADVRVALTEMGIDVFERAGTVHPREAKQPWSLVVVSWAGCLSPARPHTRT